jgi:hypothetical protein
LFNYINLVLDRAVQTRASVVAAPKDVILLAFLDSRNVKLRELFKTAVEEGAV